jgi:hypothetical protein
MSRGVPVLPVLLNVSVAGGLNVLVLRGAQWSGLYVLLMALKFQTTTGRYSSSYPVHFFKWLHHVILFLCTN